MQRLRDERQVRSFEDDSGAAQRLGHRARSASDDRTPWASASISGAQKPSCTDIEMYASARAYHASRASEETAPVKTTFSAPICATSPTNAWP